MDNGFKETGISSEQVLIEHGYGNRFQGFQNLMRLRIRDILLVSSLYDLYLFEEDGRLYELIRNEYQGLSLTHSPELTRVSGGKEAISIAKKENRFDLIITTLHIEDMTALQFAREVKSSGLKIPVVLLAFDNRELKEILHHRDVKSFDKIFIWQGDFRLIIAIIKYFEDRLNLDNDTRIAGVQSIILIEDDVRDYSSFLPALYSEILNQSQRLLQEGINLSHRFLRMRARPKILLCSDYEEAWDFFSRYQDFILGIISDIDYKRGGKQDSAAGIEFVRNIKKRNPGIPVLLQSQLNENKSIAESTGSTFLLKNSETFLNEIRRFVNYNFCFGDFVFRDEKGNEYGRAANLLTFEKLLSSIPESSLVFHSEKNHFTRWLISRTEFLLAHSFKKIRISDFNSIFDFRSRLIAELHSFRVDRQRGIISDFRKENFDPHSGFARIGSGSLGGKARGLSFVNTLINDYNIRNKFDDVIIEIPPAVVLGTEVFDQFMDENNLRAFALNTDDDIEITRKFIDAPWFPEEVLADLAAFLDIVRSPLAIRSSSMLEDSQYHSFAGVYETYMIPNRNSNPIFRLNELVIGIRKVYASTYYKSAKHYIAKTSYRLGEEKMAVIIQKLVGSEHNQKYYPDFSGTAKSYNFYPVAPQKSQDGIVTVALGLGRTIAEGGNSVRFCPKFPKDIQLSPKDMLNNNQKEFYALDLRDEVTSSASTSDPLVRKFGLPAAEEDGTLHFCGSTFSPENNVVKDGLSRTGIRIVTFSPILRHKIFPLPQIIELLLDMGTWGMGTPVEIEFAVNMSVADKPKEFGLVQMRPLVLNREVEEVDIDNVETENLFCRSNQVLGYGIIGDIYDVVAVDFNTFDRAKSYEVAKEISSFNFKLIDQERPYLLIGPGRWGTFDPWMGIPVTWEQISGARAIIETELKDIPVQPSQGSHFFHNITSFMIGYFTIRNSDVYNLLALDWLFNRIPLEQKEFTKLFRFNNPLITKMNGQINKGIILKPEDINEQG